MFQPIPQTLQNASLLPAQPASFSIALSPSRPPDGPIPVQVGNGPVITIAPDGDFDIGMWNESAVEYLQRIAAAGTVVDENGVNPLTVAYDGTTVTLSSGNARLRASGSFAASLFGSAIDVSPSPAIVFDTDTAHVRSGDRRLSAHLAEIDARVLDPFSIIRSRRRHADGATLVSKGATAGNVVRISVQQISAAQLNVPFTITAPMTHFALATLINESPDLNPEGTVQTPFRGVVGKTVQAFVGGDGEFMIQHMGNLPILLLGLNTSVDEDAVLGAP